MTWQTTPADATAVSALSLQLQRMSPGIWFEPEGPPLEPLRWRRIETFFLAALLVAGPVAAGLRLARFIHRWSPGARRAVIISVVALFPLALLGRVPLGVWDLVLVGWATAFGLWYGSLGSIPLRRVLFSGAVLVIGLILVEGEARFLREPRRFPLPEDAHLLFRPGSNAGCDALYGALDPASSVRGDRPLVLHIGDSMVAGSGVRPEDTFVARLNGSDSPFEHLNAGVSGVSTDIEYLFLKRELKELKTRGKAAPRLVVLHFNTNNDIEGMDGPEPCTGDASVLTYVDGVKARYDVPTPDRLTWSDLVRQSPAPYPLRIATSFSFLARHLMRVFEFAPPVPPEATAWPHLQLVLTEIRDRLKTEGIPLVMDVLPDRDTLESDHPQGEKHWRVRQQVQELARTLGIPTIDSWDFLNATIRRVGLETIFLPGDVHFNAEGHRVIAEWLRGQLRPRLSGIRSPAPP